MLRRSILAAALLVGCHSSSGTPAPAPEPLSQIAVATRHYAESLKGASVDTVVANYTREGELVLPGMAPLHGRDAIKKFLTPLMEANQVSSVEMDVDSVVLNAQSAEQDGRYKQSAGPKGGTPQQFHGRFHATWRHEADGKWRLSRLTMMPDA